MSNLEFNYFNPLSTNRFAQSVFSYHPAYLSGVICVPGFEVDR